MFEIEDDSNRQRSNTEIIQHLYAVVLSDPIDCLCVDDQLLLHNKIRNILPDQLAFVQHAMAFLLGVGDIAQAELNAETILINLFVQAMSANVQDFDRAAHYRIHLLT